MQAPSDKSTPIEKPLQLLLFINRRPSTKEQVRQIRSYLKERRLECDFALQIIDVGEQPYLAEHFRLIATPALIKIYPEPRQTIAGSNLVAQLQHWWSHWQRSAQDYANSSISPLAPASGVTLEDHETNDPIPAMTGRSPDTNPTPTSAQASPSFTQSTELLRLSDDLFQLKREKEELEHQLQFKDQIISMLAHDLRNPLTAASLALETLEMGYAKDSSKSSLSPKLTAQLLKHARTQTRTIDRMITDILQTARGASSKLEIRPQHLDLGYLSLDVLEHLQKQFQKKSQQVKTDIPGDLPSVLADSERVRQVLMNLLDNAIKYTPIGGTIQLAILHRTSQKVQVTICDNGPGIPLENRERIFEDHFRLERDQKQDGYGIGLSLCQRIIRAHYGQIWVDSTAQGSCFHFTLPVFRS